MSQWRGIILPDVDHRRQAAFILTPLVPDVKDTSEGSCFELAFRIFVRLIMDSMEERKIGNAFRRLRASSGSDAASQEALRNGFILQKIFVYISTNLLLSSCSLVNKTWNTEARKFVRDNRKCTARNKYSTPICEFLKDFYGLCGQMARMARVNPLNCLRLNFDPAFNCTLSGSLYNSNRFLSRILDLKLKFLEVQNKNDTYPISRCCARSLRRLLGQQGFELRSFKADALIFSEDFHHGDREQWIPKLPQLETLDIQNLVVPEDDQPNHNEWESEKKTIQWLLNNAPNLTKIAIKHISVLNTFPEEILAKVELKLSDEFVFGCRWEKDLKLLQIVSEKASGLSMLRVKSSPFFTFVSHFEDEEPIAVQLRRRNMLHQFETALQRMLQTCQGTLKTLELYDSYPLAGLCHPLFCNLSRLVINNTEAVSLRSIWDAIGSINFDRDMPGLEEVEIYIEAALGEDFWPLMNVDVIPYCCRSARKLELDFPGKPYCCPRGAAVSSGNDH